MEVKQDSGANGTSGSADVDMGIFPSEYSLAVNDGYKPKPTEKSPLLSTTTTYRGRNVKSYQESKCLERCRVITGLFSICFSFYCFRHYRSDGAAALGIVSLLGGCGLVFKESID